MGKLIDRIKVGMTMQEVKKLIPVKPYLVIEEFIDKKYTGQTKWIYTNSSGSLEIYFQDEIYIGHKITPVLDKKIKLYDDEAQKLIKRKFPLFAQTSKQFRIIRK